MRTNLKNSKEVYIELYKLDDTVHRKTIIEEFVYQNQRFMVAHMKEYFSCRATNFKISSVLFIFLTIILLIWAILFFQNPEKARICCLFGAFLFDLD